MWMVLCYLTTVVTLVGIGVSLWWQRPAHEIIAQAFLGFAIAVFFRRFHDGRQAARRNVSS